MAAVTPEVPRSGVFARCPLCFGRVALGPDDGVEAALYAHELSGFCRGHEPAKVRKPRQTKADRFHPDNASPVHSNSPTRLNDWTSMFDE